MWMVGKVDCEALYHERMGQVDVMEEGALAWTGPGPSDKRTAFESPRIVGKTIDSRV